MTYDSELRPPSQQAVILTRTVRKPVEFEYIFDQLESDNDPRYEAVFEGQTDTGNLLRYRTESRTDRPGRQMRNIARDAILKFAEESEAVSLGKYANPNRSFYFHLENPSHRWGADRLLTTLADFPDRPGEEKFLPVEVHAIVYAYPEYDASTPCCVKAADAITEAHSNMPFAIRFMAGLATQGS
jgi:hypothetical protein